MSHLDPRLLQAVLDGDLPPKVLLRRLLDHVGELCPECGEVVAALRQGSEVLHRETGTPPSLERPESTATETIQAALPDPRFVGVLDRAQNTAAEWTRRVRREKRRARADLRELVLLPRQLRPKRVEQARSRFRSRALAELLIEESRRLVRDDPAESQSLAALVGVVLLWTPGALEQDWARELAITAKAWEANAVRVAGELRAAERRFAELRTQVGREVVLSETVHAELCSLEASLRIDQGRLSDARSLLDRAAFLYRQAGSVEPLAKVLVQAAIVESRAGDPAAAVAMQRQVLAVLDKSDERRILPAAVLNLALDLNELAQPEAATEVLNRYRERLVDAGAWESPRSQTVRGRLALARNDSAEAERLFLAARSDLVRRGDPIRAAVASLDLALLYLQQGKTADLRRMARSMGQVFEAEELHEEAMATVVLFQQAVAAESLTVEALRAWRRQLESGGGRAARTPASRPS